MKFVWLLIAAVFAVAMIGFNGSDSPSVGAASTAVAPVKPAPVPVNDQLRRAGTWLVDRQGRVVILHGVNAVWKLAPYVPPDSVHGFSDADADWLSDHGFNAVRLGVLFAGVMPHQGLIDYGYLEKIDRVVKLLASREIYVMLDFHQDLYGDAYRGEGFPAWTLRPARFDAVLQAGFPLGYVTPRVSRAFDGLWDNVDDIHDDFRDAWVAVAKRWKDQDYLLGYDLINEPWSGSSWPACARPGGCPNFESNKLQRLYEHVIAGIREVDPHNIVWIEPQVLFEFGARSHLGTRPILDDQIGFSWHNYCIAATLMQAYGVKESATCARLEERVDQHAAEIVSRMQWASLLTEFGASDDLPDIRRVTANADRNMVGWTYWSYKNWGDPTTQAQGSGAQSMFRDDTELASVKLAKLAILERPYPQAIAGVPISFGFDDKARVFSLEYSTRLASGRPAPKKLQTRIHVPGLHFPNGYRVTVQGGHVVSPAQAKNLLIEADEGAARVELRVTANEK